MSTRFTIAAIIAVVFPALLGAQFPQGMRGQFNAAQFNIGRFYGKVVDKETGKGLGYASVQLLGMRYDSSSRSMQEAILAGQLSEENGDFSLEGLPIRGQFTLKISFMGYASIEQKVSFDLKMPQNDRQGGGIGAMAGSVDKDLGNIELDASSRLLQEVTVSGEASQVTLALDKKIYRVDKDGVAAGGTAEDALKNVPSLNVDIDGNLTLRNAAPQLFVDGRPTPLTLDQIPADAIEQVEVITNPSAKYDASGGSAGIVNIVLKKERRIGYNGSVRSGVDMRGRANLGADVNAREGKVNAFLSGNLNLRKSLSSGGTERQNLSGSPLTNIYQNNNSLYKGFFGMGRGGVDWFFNNRNTLTLSGMIMRGNFDSDDDLSILTDTLLGADISSSQAMRNTGTSRQFRNTGLQALYKYLFPKEGKEWTADINYNKSRSENEGLFQTVYVDSPLMTRQRQDGDNSNSFFTAQTDFENPLKAGMKIELGARAAVRNFQSENNNFQYDFASEQFQQVTGFADRYKFNDQVYAAYGTFSHSFAKWGYQAGLRAESSLYTGTLLDNDSTFTNEYPLSLFPSVFLTYKINDNDNIQLSYTRRINRPNFFQIIPFPDFSDSLLLSRGNPALKPEFTNAFEVSYQNIFTGGHNLLVSVYYRRATDLITRYQFSEYNDQLQRNTIVSSFANANSSSAYGTELTLKNTFWKKIELTTNLNFYNSIVDAQNVESDLRNEQFTWFVKENLNIKLPENFTVQFSGSYQSRTAYALSSGSRWGGWGGGPSSSAQGYSLPVWYVDFSVRKDLWNRKASLTLNIQDIFRSRKNGSYTESAFFTQDTWRRRDPQLVRLNFSYRFGKFDVSLFRRKNNRIETEGMDAGF
ncbi:MAG: TonB-dependent receptor [Lewinellaceae bacterium]|nr:TonB-dependent receptor [Lewinellaceae bacterium]